MINVNEQLPEKNRRCLCVLYNKRTKALVMDYLLYGKLCNDNTWNVWNLLCVKPEWESDQVKVDNNKIYEVAYWTYFDMDTKTE